MCICFTDEKVYYEQITGLIMIYDLQDCVIKSDDNIMNTI